MELDRGQCFCCGAGKVLIHNNPEACENLFTHLYRNDTDALNEAKEKLMVLKWCPICYHKLLFLLENLNRLEDIKSGGNKDECIVCKKDSHILRLKNWPQWKKILEEFLQDTESTICLGCMYILDIRNTLKEKIFSKYPILTRRSRSKRNAPAEVIELSDDENKPVESLSIKSLLFDKFKPLKYDAAIGNIMIKKDPKFFKQIPYTRLEICSLQNVEQIPKSDEMKNDDNIPASKKNIFFKIKFKSHNNRYSIVKNKSSKSQKSRRKSVTFYSEEEELRKYNMNNSLVINIIKNEFNSTHDDIDMDTNEIITNEEDSVVVEEGAEVTTENTECSEKPSENQLEQSTENEELNDSLASTSEETPKNKRQRPKPLSKQKKKLEDDVQEEKSEEKDLDETPKTKKWRPKPLSKQKKRLNQDTQEESPDTNNDNEDVESKEIINIPESSSDKEDGNENVEKMDVDKDIEKDKENSSDEIKDASESPIETPDTENEIISEVVDISVDDTPGDENDKICDKDQAENSQEEKSTEESEVIEINDEGGENDVDNKDDKKIEEENNEKTEVDIDKQGKGNEEAQKNDDENVEQDENKQKSSTVDDEGEEKKLEATSKDGEEGNKNGTTDDDSDIIDLNEFINLSNNDEDNVLSNKRKCSESIFSPDKKKKRVTFSDEVLESSYE